jgi:hypothetical protein
MKGAKLWKLDRNLTRSGDAIIRDPDSCQCVCCEGGTPEENFANAELIVRTCNSHINMLAALEDLVSLAEAAMHEANNDGAEYDIDGELDDARAAIAKAKRGR